MCWLSAECSSVSMSCNILEYEAREGGGGGTVSAGRRGHGGSRLTILLCALSLVLIPPYFYCQRIKQQPAEFIVSGAE